eukprot:COSAG01_NODE_2747_length_7149_cov_5.321844_2_plen_78_part_00
MPYRTAERDSAASIVYGYNGYGYACPPIPIPIVPVCRVPVCRGMNCNGIGVWGGRQRYGRYSATIVSFSMAVGLLIV